MADSFAARFAAVRACRGPLVWGLDPSGALLEAWGFGDSADGLDRFADLMVDAAVGTVGLVKPQSAFYERHGWRGIRTLQRLLADVRAAGLLAILDVKRGDVGTTNEAYAEAFLGAGAPLEADAVTVHPYLGLGAMGAFVTRAHEAGECVLVVTRSTNPEGRAVQAARGEDGCSVEETMLRRIGELNATLVPDGIGPVGAVVGPGHLEPSLDLLAARALFLAPGLGAQGANCADVARTFAACPDRVMPSASRSLLSAGPDKSAMQDAAAALAAELRAALSAIPAHDGATPSTMSTSSRVRSGSKERSDMRRP
jgi:orotidine-5'-phosphate decarboxylase